jgi:mono/diheme cytochrome c family protein
MIGYIMSGSIGLWLTAILLMSTLPVVGQSVEGKKIYRKFQCESCHGKVGNGLVDLTNGFQNYNEQKLKQYIMNPGVFGNTRMPAFENLIKEEEFNELIRYLMGLAKKPRSKG